MRTLLSVILLSCLTLPVYSIPNIRTGPIPHWLVAIQPDKDRQPLSDEISNGYYYELQEMQTNLSLQTDYFHFIRHLVSESGVQDASEVSVTYSPQYQQVVFHRISIIRAGVVLDRLRAGRISAVHEEPDAGNFEYTGLERAYMTLTDVRPGDRIDIAYSVVGFNPVFDGKYSTQQYFARSTAVCNYFRTLITTPDRPLYFIADDHATLPDRQLSGTRVIYCWSNPVLKEDEGSIPYVGITEYKDWQEVVNWGLKTFNYYQYSLPPGLLAKMAGWRRTAAGNQDLFANLATRFVQNEIRYLGLEMGVNSHRPHTPAQVFAGRYGDCKDKSLLLTCILRHEGIPAFATLVSSGDGKTLGQCSPSPRLFDHTIVAIQRPGGACLYIDPTLAGQRGELTELYIPDYGYTLLLRNGEDSLRAITVTPGQTATYRILEQLDARFDDTALFSVTTVFGGGAADKVRRSFEENSRKDIEAGYLRYYAAWLPGIKPDSAVRFNDDSTNNKVTTRESYVIPAMWRTDGEGRRSFDYSVKLIREKLPDPSQSDSNAPLTLGGPIQIDYTLHLNLPRDWDFGAGPLHIRNAAYQFDFVPEYGDREMTLHYSLVTFSDHIEAADLSRYREDLKNIDDRVSFAFYQDNSAADLAPSLGTAAAPESITGDANAHSSRPCWPAIWLTFLYILLFSRLFIWLNARSAIPSPGSPGSGGRALRGWVLILGLCIGVGFTVDAWQLFRANYYSSDNWNAWSASGGWGMQWLYLGQLGIHLNFFAGAGAVLYWYLKKRDIFPSMFIGYAAIVLIGRLVLIGMFYSLPIPAALGAYRSDLPWAFVRTGVYAAIWITYVLRSGQVRNTFLKRRRAGL